jgi:hypothetical protein
MDMLRSNAEAHTDLDALKQYVQQFEAQCLQDIEHP